MEDRIKVPQKTKNGTTIRPSNFTPKYTPEENKNTNSKRDRHHNVQSNIIYNSQDMEATCVQQHMNKEDEWIKNTVIKRNEIMPFAKTWMVWKGLRFVK